MANSRLSDAAANAEANALAALLNNGYMRMYSGTQPANANTPITTQTLLATLRLGNPAFGSASGGQITANPLTPDSDAAATGAASFARFFESDGTTVVMDVSVGTTGSGAIIQMNSNIIQQHALVSVGAFSHSVTE